MNSNHTMEKFSAPFLVKALNDKERSQRYSVETSGWLYDYSRHLIDDSAINKLIGKSFQSGLPDAIESYFSGDELNNTEGRAALHTALRSSGANPLIVGSDDIRQQISTMYKQMQRICTQVESDTWVGFSGKPIKHVVNIGVGGSYLGLKVVIESLKEFHTGHVQPFFIANIDPADVADNLSQLDPETTLFIVASKSFSTLETLHNANTAREWMINNGAAEQDLSQHFVAITSNHEKAQEFGIATENILPMWDWVGGRYSLWSAIGLIIALTIGYKNFRLLLEGADEMDEHFRSAPLDKNMPVISALLGIWYQQNFDAQGHAVISYDYGLRHLVQHLQQVDMESNGKCVTKDGQPVSTPTGGIIFGGAGTNDQHAYMQLLHQGTSFIPVDFIIPARSHKKINGQHAWLFSNAIAQANALATGKSLEEVKYELSQKGLPEEEIERLAPHKVIPGNKPSSILMCESLTPKTLGALLALYEHRVFVQSIIWNINAFDQWGVELGKEMGNTIHSALENEDVCQNMDASTQRLIEYYKKSNLL